MGGRRAHGGRIGRSHHTRYDPARYDQHGDGRASDHTAQDHIITVDTIAAAYDLAQHGFLSTGLEQIGNSTGVEQIMNDMRSTRVCHAKLSRDFDCNQCHIECVRRAVRSELTLRYGFHSPDFDVTHR